MTIRTLLRAAFAATATLAAAAQAHPGHGLTTADNPLHLLEAEHVVALLAVLAVAGGVALWRRRRDDAGRGDSRKPNQDR